MSDTGVSLAFDFGAESGRAIAGRLVDGERLELEEVHRFANRPVEVNGEIFWNVLGLFDEVRTGLTLADARFDKVASLGVDTWGVDCAFLDGKGNLLSNPMHYRNSAFADSMSHAIERVGREAIFDQTGLQFLQFNTLFQLLHAREHRPAILDATADMIMMPDLFVYWLTGHIEREFTDATTSQCWNPARGDWARDLLHDLHLPERIFGDVQQPGHIVGPILDSLAKDLRGSAPQVILPGSHDTASAVAAVPATPSGDDGWAYISCGTWALIGVETDKAILDRRALDFNFTNEGGVLGTNRLLTNCMGLWLLQRCRDRWNTDSDLNYEQIVDEARKSQPWTHLFDVDDVRFMNPADMVAEIQSAISANGDEPPSSVGPIARAILDSLAMKYRFQIERVEQLTGKPIHTIHLVGGGSRNDLLCQTTADITGRRVVAGPAECTAMGNLLMQFVGRGELKDLADIRRVARASSTVTEYEPKPSDEAQEAWACYCKLLG